jgi:hypothetical protein
MQWDREGGREGRYSNRKSSSENTSSWVLCTPVKCGARCWKDDKDDLYSDEHLVSGARLLSGYMALRWEPTSYFHFSRVPEFPPVSTFVSFLPLKGTAVWDFLLGIGAVHLQLLIWFYICMHEQWVFCVFTVLCLSSLSTQSTVFPPVSNNMVKLRCVHGKLRELY